MKNMIVFVRKFDDEDWRNIYGTFEGVLVSDDGEKIVLKNCPGIVKKSHIRL